MAGVLREHPGEVGLCSANGGYVTKHAIGLYSTDPPASGGFRHADVQQEVDRFPTREVLVEHEGPATVESYTVMHDHQGPTEALIVLLTAAGERTMVRSTDPAVMAHLVEVDAVGTPAEVRGGSVQL
jgi:acetyl-CoA C-acetyltransferase